MKQLIFAAFFIFTVLLSAQPSGSGTSGDPYQILGYGDLYWVTQNSSSWDKYFVQTSDIDLSTYSDWPSIGYDWDHAFFGHYNGGGYSITGLTVSRSGSYHGLFGVIRDGSVSNLYISGNITGTGDSQTRSGMLAGECQGSTITNCHTIGTVQCDGARVGGLIGQNGSNVYNCSFTGTVEDDHDGSYYFGGLIGYNSGWVEGCSAQASVTGNWYAGGLIGYNSSGYITDCYSKWGLIFGSYYTGGLTGYNCSSSAISGCYTECEVSGYVNKAGGFTGGNDTSTISDCYCTGAVTRNQGTDSDFGSFAGTNGGTSTVTNCYASGIVTYTGSTAPTDKGFIGNYNTTGCSGNFFDTETTSQTGGAGATGLNTEGMKTKSNYTDAGWDFTTPVWKTADTVIYPFLAWQPSSHITFTVGPEGGYPSTGIDGDYPVGTELFVWINLPLCHDEYQFINWTENLSTVLTTSPELYYIVAEYDAVLTANYLYQDPGPFISYDGSNIILEWTPVDGATYYQVFSSFDPYMYFSVDTSGTFDGTTWTAPMSSNKRFYYIVAYDSK